MKYFVILFLFIYQTFQFNGDNLNIDMENWMSGIPDDRKVLLINIPGAHDTAANEVLYGVEAFVQTQNATVPELLNFGIRRLDVRVTLRELADDEYDPDLDLGTAHGQFDCYYYDEFNVLRNLTFKRILLDIKDFLEKNPTETVIVWTQSERGDSYANIKRAVELFEKIVGNIFVKYDKNLKLGDVRGKIISTVYKTDSVDPDGNPIYHKGYDGGTDLEETHRKYIDKYYNSWEVNGELKIIEVKDFLSHYNFTIKDAEEDFDKTIEKYPINYSVSCTGEHVSIIPLPKVQADIVNPFLLQYDFLSGYYYGWIDMDFANRPNVIRMVITNFLE